MWNFILVLAMCGVCAAVELRKLWRQKRIKECWAYILLDGAGLVIIGMYLLWEDLPSIHTILTRLIG